MRPRKWILLLIFFIFVFFIILWYVKEWLEKNRSLEKIVTEVISSAIKGKCEVEKIRVGFLSFYLKDVSIAFPSDLITIKIKEIKSGLSIVKLLKYRGEMSRSISSIVFIKPHIFIYVKQSQGGGVDSFPISPTLLDKSKGVPASSVQEVIIKDGVVGFLLQREDTLLMAQGLNGRMNSSADELTLKLDGRFGSIKKNFYIDLFYSLLRDSTVFSVRLKNASLSRHVVLNKNRISSGFIDGNVTCTIVGSNFPENIDLKGGIKLKNGSGEIVFPINKKVLPISSVETDIVFMGKEYELKEAKALFRGMSILAKGKYTLAPRNKAVLKIESERFFLDSLYDILPDSLKGLFSGEIRARSSLTWCQDSGLYISFSSSKGKLKNIPIDRIKIKGKIVEDIFTAESIMTKTPFFKSNIEGKFYLAQPDKNFDIRFTTAIDSLPEEYNLKGDIVVRGKFSGSLNHLLPEGEASVFTKNIIYRNLPLGNHSTLITFKKDKCTFTTLSSDTSSTISIEGTIDNFFSPTPILTFAGVIGDIPIKNYLERSNKILPIDSIKLSLKGKGWLNKFDASLFLMVKGKDWGGHIEAMLFRDQNTKAFFNWKASTAKFKFKDYPLLIKAEGKAFDTMVAIENISDSRGVKGKFNIYHLSKPPRIQGYIEYKKNISELLELMKDNSIPFEKGIISGRAKIEGSISSISTKAFVKIEDAGNDLIDGLYSSIYLESKGKEITFLPTIVRLDTVPLIFLDTVKIKNNSINLNGKFDNVSLDRLLKKVLPSDINIEGKISGYISSKEKDSIVRFFSSSSKIGINSVGIDSIICKGHISSNGINIEKILFNRDTFVNFIGEGFLPWSTFSEHSEDKDTLRLSIKAEGDFLAAIENSIKSPIGGNGKGSAEIAFFSTEGNWTFTKGLISIPEGLLKVKYFVPDNVKKFNFLMRIDSNCTVHTDMGGLIKKRPIRIFSEHRIPDGYEPFMIGPLNFGVLQVITPKKGVDLHLVGFMAIKDRGDIEFKGKKPFSHFTLSGPIDKLKITGVWIVRDMDFTFPLLNIEKLDYNFDPFPYVTWEFDLYPGNRKVMYFWDVTGKKNRLVRFLECYLEPSSYLKVRGRDLDKNFRVYGSLRSYRGAFYYGRVFNRNLEIGVDFVPIKKDDGSGYDNMPILFGSAEAFSDSSRHDRIKITCMVEDPLTGTVSEKGRLKEQFPPNIIFNLSSNFEGIPDETELEFYRSAGIKFKSIEGTGTAVSDFGEQLFHTYLLQKWERFIAKRLGLDVMNIETSIVSNYFNKLYSRRFTSLFDVNDYMAFANVGVTIGRYFFRDYLLLKARSELIPVDMMLTPEYSIGFELQPSKYFIMDINYGVNIRESKIVHSPLLMMQLRLPISKMRKFFNF